MNNLTPHSETARHGGAGLASLAGPNLTRKGDTVRGGRSAHSVHNFTNNAANWPRIVMVGIGQGVSVPFECWSFHGGQYD